MKNQMSVFLLFVALLGTTAGEISWSQMIPSCLHLVPPPNMWQPSLFQAMCWNTLSWVVRWPSTLLLWQVKATSTTPGILDHPRLLRITPLEAPLPRVNTLSHMQPAATNNSTLSNKRAVDSVEDLISNMNIHPSFIFCPADTNFLMSNGKLTIKNVSQVYFGMFYCRVLDNARIIYRILQLHGKNTVKVKCHNDYQCFF